MNANLTMKLRIIPYRYFIANNFSFNFNRIKSLFTCQLESLKAFYFYNFHQNLNKISLQNSQINLKENLEEKTNEKIDFNESIMKITTHKRKKIKMKKQKFWKRRRMTRNSTKN